MSFEQIFYAMFAMMYGMLLLCAWVLLDVIPVIHTDHGWGIHSELLNSRYSCFLIWFHIFRTFDRIGDFVGLEEKEIHFCVSLFCVITFLIFNDIFIENSQNRRK